MEKFIFINIYDLLKNIVYVILRYFYTDFLIYRLL